ncbi:MAG: O-methyltransferase [Fimbriimonadaceae bacterium]
MEQATWDAVDAYIGEKAVHEDDALRQAALDSEAAGLPSIAVTPAHGKMLHLFARMVGARRILEIGTLGGYSAIWLARALPPDGKLVTLEMEPKHAEVAGRNIARAGVADRVEIVLGPAIESLPKLEGPFDMAFIDADKQSTREYFEWAMKLVRPGGVIVVDNVVRGGKVAQGEADEMVAGIRRFFDALPGFPGARATAIQTVGGKGYDGFALVVVA